MASAQLTPDAELTPDNFREALRVCFDPELGVNIVDLGMVEAIRMERDTEAPGTTPRYRIHLTLLRRTGDDQRQAMLQGQIENRLMGMREISLTVVEVSEHVWTADRITTAGRQQLGLDRSAKPGLIQIRL